ncbi:bacterio-opsin activator domain-containing protein [Natronosalvus caseinilyticus]|uniref:bacterio-opsin activator domain-containing protein n=1 Tax=Natronosalvus caseinilyticus TaxID=2953747 RepID=UPI0028A6FB28|nr:bacterio-opsin activator domain-containing protein [Natronosalvus caseinilyticus]
MTETMRVLVVDNDARFAELTTTMLERERDDIMATDVSSADAALDVLEADPIECIVSDYDMPKTNGLELLEAVRERDLELPFILFTGKGSEEIASEAIAAGVTQYLQKQPGSDRFTLLANQIENAVAQYRTETELRENERRYERTLTALHDTTRDLMRAGTKDEIYEAAVETAGAILEVPIVSAYRFEPAEGTLAHAASTAETRQLLTPAETVGRGDGLIWEAFSEGEPQYYANVRAAGVTDVADTVSRSKLVVPLGTHGIVVAGSERPDRFDESMRELLYILGANTEAALDRAEREQLLREHDRTLTEQNEELTRLNHTNEIVRAINRGIAKASTREEIERTVCQRLAETDRYLCAWITAGQETPSPTVWEGIDVTYVDRVREDGAGAPEAALIERALETESVQVVENVLDDEAWADRRKAALTYGYQTVLAVPLLDAERRYGAIVVHAPQADAISESEREVLGELGETIGHAIRSVERTRAMLTDSRLEIELECQDPQLLFNRLGTIAPGTITLEGIIDRAQETVLFVSIEEPPVDEILDLAERWAVVDSLSVVSDGEESTLFEVTIAPTPFVELLREYDAHVTSTTTNDEVTTIALSVPSQIDTRALVESIQDHYPETELAARRETTSSVSSTRFDARLEESLTAKQFEALQAAHYSGFFEWPRESTGEDLAAALDVTPPTYHYHLRAAQRKLVSLAFGPDSN